MTREAVRAEQDDTTGPAPRLTRVIITAVQDSTITVQLPGGATTTAPRIAGCVYTTGGAGYAMVQEPAVGPVTPTGNALPAGLFPDNGTVAASQNIKTLAPGSWRTLNSFHSNQYGLDSAYQYGLLLIFTAQGAVTQVYLEDGTGAVYYRTGWNGMGSLPNQWIKLSGTVVSP